MKNAIFAAAILGVVAGPLATTASAEDVTVMIPLPYVGPHFPNWLTPLYYEDCGWAERCWSQYQEPARGTVVVTRVRAKG